jgi:hypothetical protein
LGKCLLEVSLLTENARPPGIPYQHELTMTNEEKIEAVTQALAITNARRLAKP